MTPNRILSGVQPTGNLHLGNYLGAIRNWVTLQDEHECLFMLADLHAITVPQEPAALRRHVRETAAAYLACGVQPDRSAIFPQSAVSGHSELAWILSCHTPLGWLNRMTQFKEKANQGKTSLELLVKAAKDFSKTIPKTAERIEAIANKFINRDQSLNYEQQAFDLVTQISNETFGLATTGVTADIKIREAIADIENSSKARLGLYSYPVLMAADIILYKATHVPVGEDQKQHLELARDIAGAFNRAYSKEFFPLPEPLILGEATRVMSLRDGTRKMSKSDESEYSRINLTDEADAIALKIRKAKSDMIEGMSYSPERPEASNLLNLYAAVTGQTKEAALAECESLRFSDFKVRLADAMVAHLSPISSRMRELLAQPDYLDGILRGGIQKAREVSGQTMKEVKEMVGFLYA